MLRRVRDPERRCLRRMRTGEWLGSRFHRSRRSKERLRNTGRLPRPLDLDLRLRSEERDLERLLRSPDLDLFRRPVERLLDRLLRSVDLDLLLLRALGERDLLLRAGERERERDRWDLPRDLERDRLRRALERDLRRRVGLLDFRFFLSGETDFFLLGDFDLQKGKMGNHKNPGPKLTLGPHHLFTLNLTPHLRDFHDISIIALKTSRFIRRMQKNTTHLDCFFLDTDLDLDLRGDEFDRESFL